MVYWVIDNPLYTILIFRFNDAMTITPSSCSAPFLSLDAVALINSHPIAGL